MRAHDAVRKGVASPTRGGGGRGSRARQLTRGPVGVVRVAHPNGADTHSFCTRTVCVYTVYNYISFGYWLINSVVLLFGR